MRDFCFGSVGGRGSAGSVGGRGSAHRHVQNNGSVCSVGGRGSAHCHVQNNDSVCSVMFCSFFNVFSLRGFLLQTLTFFYLISVTGSCYRFLGELLVEVLLVEVLLVSLPHLVEVLLVVRGATVKICRVRSVTSAIVKICGYVLLRPPCLRLTH